MVNSIAGKLAENPVNRKAKVAISVEGSLEQLYKASPAAEFQSFNKTTSLIFICKSGVFCENKKSS